MLDHITVEGQPAAHGTGDDFVVLDDQDAHLPPPSLVRREQYQLIISQGVPASRDRGTQDWDLVQPPGSHKGDLRGELLRISRLTGPRSTTYGITARTTAVI